MSITESDKCSLCKLEPETYIHLFTSCKYTKDLWENVNIWIKSKLNKTLNFSPMEIIVGHIQRDNFFLPINTILNATKHHTFCYSKNGYVPKLAQLKSEIEKIYEEQSYLHKISQNEDAFSKQWSLFKKLFST